MARSNYIYTVYWDDPEQPWGCFTVKHEMITAIKRSGLLGKMQPCIERYHDGEPGSFSDISKQIRDEIGPWTG